MSQFTDIVEYGGGSSFTGIATKTSAASSSHALAPTRSAVLPQEEPRSSKFDDRFVQTTAAGMYQINIATWRQHGGNKGLTDFSPKTLRSIHVIDNIKEGDIASAVGPASRKWAALPVAPGLSGRHANQPSVKYDDFFATYQANGGKGK